MIIMKNIFLLTLFLLTFNYSQGQFTLTNGKKTKIIDNRHKISFNGKEISLQGDTIDYYYSGLFISKLNDSIIIRPKVSKLVINYSDKRNIDITTDYWIDSTTKTRIAISTIKNIKTSDKTIDAVCATIWTLGIITSTIISPLISINFKNGTFNKSKYATVTGLSIASIAVSVSFDLTFSKRKFRFNKQNNPWQIKT